MKEMIHTIPVNEAFASGDECPFCYLEREAEQRVIDYAIGPGASYMEPDMRATTDKEGFCGTHLKKMFDYGNALGNALILQTYFIGMMQELEQQMEDYELPEKRQLFRRKKENTSEDALTVWLDQKLDSCFICNRLHYNMERYFATFFVLLKEEEFRTRVENCKGFCMRHFLELMRQARTQLPNGQREWFYDRVFSVHWENLNRVKEDLDWLIKKYDYRYAGEDWKNSRDALNRAMQKYQGLYPADPPFKSADFGTRKK